VLGPRVALFSGDLVRPGAEERMSTFHEQATHIDEMAPPEAPSYSLPAPIGTNRIFGVPGHARPLTLSHPTILLTTDY
jgi:hypothetical protein